MSNTFFLTGIKKISTGIEISTVGDFSELKIKLKDWPQGLQCLRLDLHDAVKKMYFFGTDFDNQNAEAPEIDIKSFKIKQSEGEIPKIQFQFIYLNFYSHMNISAEIKTEFFRLRENSVFENQDFQNLWDKFWEQLIKIDKYIEQEHENLIAEGADSQMKLDF